MGAPQLQLQLTYEKMTLFNDERVNYSKYSKFRDIEDFNNEWEQYMVNYKKKFTKLQLDAIRIYRQHAVTEGRVGVVNASYRTLIERAKEYYGFEISRDTFRDAINKLANLGGCIIADGERLINGRGSRTANIVIFNRHDEAVAYQIAQQKKKDEEIARLLEENYAAASPVMNYAYNARKWAEEKRLKQAEAAAQQAAARKKEAEEVSKARKVSLYSRLAKIVSTRKSLKTIQLKEAVAIAYSSVKKLVALNVPQQEAEEMAYRELAIISQKDNVKNVAALYSWTLNKAITKIKGEDTELTKAELNKKKGVYVEYIPEWMIDREKDPVRRAEMIRSNEIHHGNTKVIVEEEEVSVLDFEAERARILAKLGQKNS